jgi:tyrosinase
MKRGHADRMNEVLRSLSGAGPEVEDGILKAKALLKAGVNPDLMRHAFGIYLTHSQDAQRRRIVIPPLKNHAMFLSQRSAAVAAATAQPSALAVVTGEVVTPDTFQGPALLSYWREDYDYNDHHVHWHMVFPGTGVVVDGVNVQVIDRQGELFLYMHSQMVTRYETEGVCWNLPLVRPWNQYDDVLESGYVPVPALCEFYGGYPPFSSWFATKNPNIPDTKDQPVPRAMLETWRDNIYQGIKDGYFWTKNGAGESKKLVLTEDNCANLVGVVIEAESAALQLQPDGYSLDGEKYGNLHNFGHDKFAELGYHNYMTKTNPYGLMISNFGSPRDAAFWPWHKHVQYFGRLAAAKFPQDVTAHKAAVTLSDLSLRPQSTQAPHYAEGGITTVMGPPAVNLMESRAKLDHEPYQWSVQIKSTRSNPSPSVSNPQVITLRLFIAAKELMEDYHNWIEMDKVTATLTSESSITEVRLDKDSSVARKMSNYSELDAEWASSWCRCGWPQNMMLPVGKVEGMAYVAFCMATDDALDTCVKTPALSYCGAMQNNRKYPDPRGMGYPFNREWTQHIAEGTNTISTIISNNALYPFMATSSFKIFRTTKPFLFSDAPPPASTATWNNTINDYFLSSDVTCMLHEYGYDLSNPDDVALHSAAIYDATVHQRMPLQMPPFSQEKPDPKHPMWTADMCNTFNIWRLNGCPVGDGPGPGPPTTATWDNTIKDYFLSSDVACMKSEFDLSKHADVASNASAIYAAVSSKSMPLQMSPFDQSNPDPKHPLWSTDMCDTFKAWMQNGCK